MVTSKTASAVAGINITPSIKRSAEVTVSVSKDVPTGVSSVGVAVGADGAVPPLLGLDRATLVASGFDGKVGQTLVLPRLDGPTVVAVGIGDPAELDASGLRDAAAAYARAAGKHGHLVTTLADVASVPPDVAGQVIVEGALLARYHYDAFKQQAFDTPLTALTLVAPATSSRRA
jgi:leucyl aminopeptidase